MRLHSTFLQMTVKGTAALGAAESDVEKAAEAFRPFLAESASPAPSAKSLAAFWSSDQGLRVFGLPFGREESVRVASSSRTRPVVHAASRPHSYVAC